ncbi:MAG: twin-arginine translocase subunit TatC [Parabacteroides sp.]|jgi:sec-independent protein translocase protein TatC|nr:twin-arginine translocase subunit TatC [Parabacteroides sp.]MBP8758628.1 twin-arginine translocase subunit TatC [Parabacteroides sp.]MBP9480585.1 twin-arginine translocase subunit TatC [Parabacteroides sp.]MBP9578337.1 twin-arginine translocase subunit TatC [Parabacteroides sp.]MDD2415203.1 twin-arginine translocase subunit TatC [Parabacteroides sp.]
MQQDEMSFWDHLEELRWTLFRTVLALFVFAIGGFVAMPYLFDNVILAPCSSDFIMYREMCKLSQHFSFMPDFCNDTFHVDIVNIKLASQFFTHMTTSFWLAVLLAFPYMMYEVWRFISPALYENEKKNVRWVFLFGNIMFFIGCSVGYFLVFPMTLRFLATYQLSAQIVEQVSLDSYMDNFLMLVFIMGVVFEMPLVSWLLSQIGLLHKSFFHKYRRHAIVALLVGAAFITPSSDPFTLSIVFIPLYFLYELSAFFVKKDPIVEEDED